MKRFFAALLVLLIAVSMSACTKTTEQPLVNADGEVKGYVRAHLETLNEYCTKLEFMDSNKNITTVMEATEENLYYRWGIFDDTVSDRSPITFQQSDAQLGCVYIHVWDSEKKGMAGKEYYTFPCSGKIMEEYTLKDNGSGVIFYTSATRYNEDGSVNWSYVPKFGVYLVFGLTGSVEKSYFIVEELDEAGETVCKAYYHRDTLELDYAVREIYTAASANAPTHIYWYSADFSLLYAEENVFDSEGYITDTILYDANGNIIDQIPE